MRDSSERLKAEWSYLRGTWENAREHWQDAVARHFEQRFWSNWEREVPRTLASLQELEKVLQRIKKDSTH